MKMHLLMKNRSCDEKSIWDEKYPVADADSATVPCPRAVGPGSQAGCRGQGSQAGRGVRGVGGQGGGEAGGQRGKGWVGKAAESRKQQKSAESNIGKQQE